MKKGIERLYTSVRLLVTLKRILAAVKIVRAVSFLIGALVLGVWFAGAVKERSF